MKLDKLLEHLQKQINTNNVENTTLPSTSQQTSNIYSQQVLNNLLNYSCSTTNVVPLNEEDASQGLLAVGGCRQCSKTFTDRLSLIHHFADHFPNIFYSFEERPLSQKQHNPLNINIPQIIPSSISPRGINGDLNINDIADQQQSSISSKSDEQILGQLVMFLSLFGINPNNCSQQIMTNFLSSLQMPIKNNNLNFMGMPPTTTTINSSFPNLSPQNQFNLNKINENLFDKNELTGNNLINLKNHQTPLGRKKRKYTAENIIENSFVKNGNIEKNEAKKSAESIGMLQQPILSELPYHMCPHCCLTFAETANYKAHLEMHKQPVQITTAMPQGINSFFCDSQNDEKQKQQTKCPLCEMEFSNVFRLNEHIRLHSAHSCDICQKKFMTAFDLNLHMGTHTGFTYDCKDCGKCFPCRKTLAEHNRSHRIILSNTNICKNNDTNNNNPKNQVSDNKQKQLIYEMENSPILKCFDQQQNIEQNGRKKVRATRKGEKSRRNATLVALESTTTTVTQQTETLKTTNLTTNDLPQTSPLINCFNNSHNVEDVEQKQYNCDNSAMGIMGNILMRANSLLSVYGQNVENEQKPQMD
ncbi:hypothetical protein ACQ4LE_007442 [Meloidogyne hapla]|uniref:C2H2-type domain-containing protein n=1 Tax=Meloidogyne hapla TaxID=6305 RepID=A0A1I8BMP2_MELHA